MNPKEKAIIYARVSSKEQEETGYSLPAQEKLLREYADRNDFEVDKVFSVAESASGTRQRAVFAEMLEYLAAKGINHLLCEKVDRLTRNLKEAVEANDWIDGDAARKIHFVKTGLVLHQAAKSDEKFRWDIEIVLAKKHISNLSEEVKKGQAEKVAQGWLPTKPPLGYRTVGDKGHKYHVVDETVAPQLKLMFEEFASGHHSISSITQMLYERGLRSRGGYKLARGRVHSLLQDPFYYGDFRWKGVIYKGQHEPLITKEIFEKVQDTLHNRNTGKNFKHDYLFKGLVKCRDCGGTVTWEKQKGIVYGHCSAYRNCIKRQWYREERFATAVQQQLDTLKIAQPRLAEWVTKALKHIHAEEISKQDNVIAGLRSQQNRLRQRKEMLYNDRLDSRISTEEYDARVAQTDDELKSIENAMVSQQRGERTYYELAEAILELSQRAGEIFAEAKPAKQKRLLSLICQEIYVDDGKLHLNFTEEFRMLKELAIQLNSSKAEKPVVSPIQIFELANSGSNKEQNAPIEASCPTLLRR